MAIEKVVVATPWEHVDQRSFPLFERHFARGKTDSIETWNTARLGAYHDDALRELLLYSVERSPFYRARLSATPGILTASSVSAELEDLPCTTREQLTADPWAFVTQPMSAIAEIFVSSGTSGAPSIFVAHSYDDAFINDLAPDMPHLIPLQRDDLVINALPYEMSSAGLSFHRVFVHGIGAAVLAAGKDGCYGDPASCRRLIDAFGASALITSPSYAIRMIEGQPQPADAPPGGLTHMWLTGEACSDSLRRRIERLWGCRANLFYGSLECGVIGIECDIQDGYHVAAGHVYVEILDDAGGACAPGEVGEIVVTVLLRRAMPLLRYRTGDLGYLDDIPCPCGTVLPRLYLRGRRGDQLRLSTGDVSPVFVEEMLMREADVGLWYRLHDDGPELFIEIVTATDVVASDMDIADRVATRLEYAIGTPVRVAVVDRILHGPGKVKRVVRAERTPE